MYKKSLFIFFSFCLLVLTCTGCREDRSPSQTAPVQCAYGPSQEPKSISILVNNNIASPAFLNRLSQAETELGIEIHLDYRSTGSNGDVITKTRLATGEMSDICAYNSGSLLTALKPKDYFVDLSDQAYIQNLEESFLDSVTVDGAVYGIPQAYTNSVGAVLYNKKLYEKYRLSLPRTWDDFLKNCEILKRAGKTAVIGAFSEDWTSQVILLADYYNVQSAQSDFADLFEQGIEKHSSNPAMMQSWKKCEDLVPYYNANASAADYRTGCDMLIQGSGAHFIIMTGMALPYLYREYPDQIQEIGLFAIPGSNPEEQGITLWPAGGLYINKKSQNIENALRLFEFLMSEKAVQSALDVMPLTGPLSVTGMNIQTEALPAVKEAMTYMENGRYSTALEYQTIIKGDICPSLTRMVALGQMTAENAAQEYDADCRKQAILLGLNWE